MSVTLAPRCLIAKNAAWPGVSRKVIVLPLGLAPVVNLAEYQRLMVKIAEHYLESCREQFMIFIQSIEPEFKLKNDPDEA